MSQATQFMPDVSPEERLQIMRDTAHSIETTSYLRPLTNEELDVKRETLTDNAIKLSEKEEELDGIKKRFKEQMDPLKRSNKELLHEIKTRQQEVKGTIFNLANYESSMMETFDEEGMLISSRRLRPDEKQGKVFPLPNMKTGTED